MNYFSYGHAKNNDSKVTIDFKAGKKCPYTIKYKKVKIAQKNENGVGG